METKLDDKNKLSEEVRKFGKFIFSLQKRCKQYKREDDSSHKQRLKNRIVKEMERCTATELSLSSYFAQNPERENKKLKHQYEKMSIQLEDIRKEYHSLEGIELREISKQEDHPVSGEFEVAGEPLIIAEVRKEKSKRISNRPLIAEDQQNLETCSDIDLSEEIDREVDSFLGEKNSLPSHVVSTEWRKVRTLGAVVELQEEGLGIAEKITSLNEETIEIGKEASKRLKLQTEKLKAVKEEQEDLSREIKRGRKLVRDIRRRISGDKCLILAIAFVILSLIVLIIIRIAFPDAFHFLTSNEQ